MNIKHFAALLVVGAAVAITAQAQTTYDWSFVGTTNNGSGTLVAQDTTSTGWDAVTGYLVTSISGTWNSDTIAALEGAPGADGSASELLISFDNADPLLDKYGLSFTTASSGGINFYSNGTAGQYFAWTGPYSGGHGIGSGDFTITAVPEPTTLALSVLGGLGGLVMYRRRQ